jgi:hypothetical protein
MFMGARLSVRMFLESLDIFGCGSYTFTAGCAA